MSLILFLGLSLFHGSPLFLFQNIDGGTKNKSLKQTQKIQNPYFEKRQWKVWRDDSAPVKNVTSMKHEGKKKVAYKIDLIAPPQKTRIYPIWPTPKDSPIVQYKISSSPSTRFAGIWDDVYSSWSGLHGYVRNSWRGTDGSKVMIRKQIIHFVDAKKKEMMRAGVNFIHQSTTGMAHTITNGYNLRYSRFYEKLYFADLLVCSPAHASYTEVSPEQTSDLYICHSPTLFNSLGSSNSETMAITKMVLVGGYLRPKLKLLLKRNGLYPSTLLYLWKAALPYDVPYDHELKHKVCYKSVGNRLTYPERYSAAGIDRGDLALIAHQYNDLEHMRRMVEIAASMEVAPPEACFEVLDVRGGTQRFAFLKSALILQEKGKKVQIRVSTKKSYDIQGLPLRLHWKLLYGNRATRMEPSKKNGEFLLTIPWNDALPEGRTVLGLFANNGRQGGNPALLTVYRKKGEIPPNGGGYKDYRFNLGPGNRRPILMGLQDTWVKPGKTLKLALRAWDPEGFPVLFAKPTNEVGEIKGSTFLWKSSRKEKNGTKALTIFASDGTSGNGYTAKQIKIQLGKPRLLAQITADHLVGKAPFKVHFSAKKSIAHKSASNFYWDVFKAAKKRKVPPLSKQKKGKDLIHTFKKPGIYEVFLTIQQGKEKDQEHIQILVTKNPLPLKGSKLQILGNGVLLENGDSTPNPFDNTGFLVAGTHRYVLRNTGDKTLKLARRKRMLIEGENAKDFHIVDRPPLRIPPHESAIFSIRFRPKADGPRKAWVQIQTSDSKFRFRVGR
jgi:hypothetical protein